LRSASYSANTLNQYTSRDVPGAVDLMGLGLATNTVTVNGQTAYRKGEYFRQQLTVNNASAPVWQSVTNSETGQTSVTGAVFVPKTPENFYYDQDGNLTNDGRWRYSWDAENRLISLTTNTAAGPQQSIKFEYDWRGRRIHKQVWSNPTWNGTPTNDVKFVNDGWNLLAELNSTNNSVIRSFMWGLDLSGSPQGAGGVGGLLEVIYKGGQTTNCFVAFDGNGNVSALTDAGGTTILAQYEYGPFGEVIRATGPMAKANPFRFSTKYQDDESDLLYYGYRYYNPSTGRWFSKDPSEEDGGVNLSSAMGNDCIGNIDALGENFIVVGSRRLVVPILNYEHMSVEYFKEKCPKIEEGHRFNSVGEVAPDATRVDFYQLQAAYGKFGHYVWRRPKPTEPPQREFVGDWISYIERASTATRRIVIYSDITSGNAKAAWARIKQAAESYAYAEQYPIGLVLTHWPNSRYQFPRQLPGNNSNTFAREMARVVGRDADVIGGEHPGAIHAGPVPFPGYTPVRRYNQATPEASQYE
jgi:RHS repeat-associated protein